MCPQVCVLYEVVTLSLLLDMTLSGLLQDRHCIVRCSQAGPWLLSTLGPAQSHLLLASRLITEMWAAQQKLIVITIPFVQQQ